MRKIEFLNSNGVSEVEEDEVVMLLIEDNEVDEVEAEIHDRVTMI